MTTPEAALSHGRFNNLFNHKEFLTYIERFQYKDKRLKEITKNVTSTPSSALNSALLCDRLFRAIINITHQTDAVDYCDSIHIAS